MREVVSEGGRKAGRQEDRKIGREVERSER